jgi:dihydrofolate synthase/folylpolyglutamate synthase
MVKLTTLDTWLTYIESIHAKEIDLSLERVGLVAQRLSIQFDFATVITVAGTNGKGTTCAFLENALIDLGHSVAVYSSPHIHCFTERLRINKQQSEPSAWVHAFEAVEQARGDISLSYYEFTTLAAFLMLMALKPTIIILEVGLGGRLDATNIIDADIAVITTIDLDHQAFLGDTREAIGLEKAGIMRTNKVCVIGDKHVPESVTNFAIEQQVPCLYRDKDFSIVPQQSHFQFTYKDHVFSPLKEPFIPADNVATALAVIAQLAIDYSVEQINRWIEQTKVSGRMEQVNSPASACPVIFDVAHNPQAGRYLAQQLTKLKHQRKGRFIAVMSMLKDKDITQTLAPLLTVFDQWYIAPLANPRAASLSQLQQALDSVNDRMISFDNIHDAFKMAAQSANTDDTIIVFGSFFTVAEIRTSLVKE